MPLLTLRPDPELAHAPGEVAAAEGEGGREDEHCGGERCAVLDTHEEARDEGAAEMDEVAHLLVVRLWLRVRVGVRAKGQGVGQGEGQNEGWGEEPTFSPMPDDIMAVLVVICDASSLGLFSSNHAISWRSTACR